MTAPANSRDQPAGGATVAQLKNDIDQGRTGDKVAFSDPGLSPLGTDDEAGGFPASPEQIALARKQEKALGEAAIKDDPSAKSNRLLPLLIVVAIVAVIIAGAIAALVMSR